ncbi:uncharacterized protein LOC131024659 [Salvia miltiorrhiza]|uniref:uncharacterized protein LOC131024659 n=1 Tax=Salvia miltiorrhiza TaxID=226208 RepID=UPI0025AC4265|nr:uncharacterized protein LOC131024659 [Salvia miltiorrhiza]XP_057810150.1 uncharacterized protein LOC131024659 [Salvia miltiorrhiza]XP_057810151.1 uncharacterized protein LOC131024659 [Salvia miltiorrhiza]XP_057810152.1 uncharacterized protein LOC131024659 [Salvia miltiorrhiza]
MVPCNVCDHWILTIIDPYKEEAAMLDPFYDGIHDGVWKQVVQLALKLFNAQKQRKGRKMSSWSVIKVPKQPDNFQCGFYVMKYMKEIVECDGSQTIGSLHSLLDKPSYSKEDIDDVRKEWADCVQDHILE